jgi:hypothetical protein
MAGEAKGSILLLFLWRAYLVMTKKRGRTHTEMLRETSRVGMVKEAGHVPLMFENTRSCSSIFLEPFRTFDRTADFKVWLERCRLSYLPPQSKL